MSSVLISLLSTVVGALMALVGVWITNRFGLKIKEKELQASKRQNDLDYYRKTVEWLATARGELQFLHILIGEDRQNTELIRQREEAYGRAYGMLLSLGKGFYGYADRIMDEKSEPDEKLSSLDDAIKALGELIKAKMYEEGV